MRPEGVSQPLVALPPVFGVDLSITREVVLLWVAAAVTFVVLTVACRRRELVARGMFRNLFEALIEWIEREIVRGSMGPEGRAWAPFVLTVFFFVLFSNLLGMVPAPTVFKAATASVSVTAALALAVFGVATVVALRRQGWIGFGRRFLPEGLPWWGALLMMPLEVLSWLARPVSLALRLFANMVAGHELFFVFVGLEMTAAWYLKALPFIGAVAMGCFELFVCFIQAFIFAMLTAAYLREALERPHGGEPAAQGPGGGGQRRGGVA